MTPNPIQGVKSDSELTPLIVCAGPTVMPPQYYKLALLIVKHHHQTYKLTEEIFAWYSLQFSL